MDIQGHSRVLCDTQIQKVRIWKELKIVIRLLPVSPVAVSQVSRDTVCALWASLSDKARSGAQVF